jgi:hypothetical protein
MLFLPDSLYRRTQQLIRDVETNPNALIDVLRDVIVARERDPPPSACRAMKVWVFSGSSVQPSFSRFCFACSATRSNGASP